MKTGTVRMGRVGPVGDLVGGQVLPRPPKQLLEAMECLSLSPFACPSSWVQGQGSRGLWQGLRSPLGQW